MCWFSASALISTQISQYLTVVLYRLWFGPVAIPVSHKGDFSQLSILLVVL